MTYNDEEAGVAGEDDSIILRKYFGVKDKSALKELYTSTSSDASFYKVRERRYDRVVLFSLLFFLSLPFQRKIRLTQRLGSVPVGREDRKKVSRVQ